MITLKKLAELSGLSIRTVGRVLSGHPYVAPEKRDRVLELVQKYRYSPNMAARNFRLQRKKFVGIMFGNYLLSSHAQLLNMLNRQLVKNEFWPLLGCFDDPSHCVAMLKEWAGIAEYVVVLHELHNHVIDKLREIQESLPLKFIYADCVQNVGDYTFSVNRPDSVRRMIRELPSMGFKHLLYCGSLESRAQGVQAALQDNLPMQIESLPSPLEFEDGYRLGDQVVQSGADVVFFDTDRMAFGFYHYAAQKQIPIPDRIAVIGCDGEQSGEYMTPPLASLTHPRQQIVDYILGLLRTGQKPPEVPLMMEIVHRDSLLRPAHP